MYGYENCTRRKRGGEILRETADARTLARTRSYASQSETVELMQRFP